MSPAVVEKMRKRLLLAPVAALSAALCWYPALSWTYQSETDMHGTANYASVTSDNSETLSFPYHGGPARLWIRKHPKYGTDVYINVPDGQIICNDYDGCSVPVKFDDGKVERFTGVGPADISSTTLFIRNASRFISKAKKAKTVIIELTFYQDGDHQYVFDRGSTVEAGRG
jgi:hypothetical protein